MKILTTLFISFSFLISCSNSETKTQLKDTAKNISGRNVSITSQGKETSKTDTSKEGAFNVGDTKFRYFVIDDKCTIDKFEKEHWINNLSFDYSYRTDTLFADVNNDGFIDVINSWKWYSQAFLFNPKTKAFDTTDIGLSDFWELIDSSRNIYCEESNIKGKEESSMLYTFDGLTKKVLYSVSFTLQEIPSEDLPIITKLSLYKGDFEDKNSKYLNTINVEKGYEFDCVKFWSSKYKELLGYR